MNYSPAQKPAIANSKSEIHFRWWRPILGTLLVLAGLATAVLTLMARRLGVPELTSTGAIASLVFVLLIMLLVVPPLTRSAFAEVSATGFPLEITTGGVVFIVILVIVAFAAWNTGNNLLFLIFSIMLATIFVSWMSARQPAGPECISPVSGSHFRRRTSGGHRYDPELKAGIAFIFNPGRDAGQF